MKLSASEICAFKPCLNCLKINAYKHILNDIEYVLMSHSDDIQCPFCNKVTRVVEDFRYYGANPGLNYLKKLNINWIELHPQKKYN